MQADAIKMNKIRRKHPTKQVWLHRNEAGPNRQMRRSRRIAKDTDALPRSARENNR